MVNALTPLNQQFYNTKTGNEQNHIIASYYKEQFC